MEVRKLQYVDVHFNEDEKTEAKRQGEYLISLGYVLEHEDVGCGDYTYCNQYWKPMRFLKTI